MQTTPAPSGAQHRGRRPFLLYLPRALYWCLGNYPTAAVGSFILASILAQSLRVDPFDAVLGWLLAALLASGIWYSMEPSLQRLWGDRPPTEQQLLRLRGALSSWSGPAGAISPTLLIEDDARVAVRSGLRTVVLTRGAFVALDDQKLGSLFEHGRAHVTGRALSRSACREKTCAPL
jgi:hypothetical protein